MNMPVGICTFIVSSIGYFPCQLVSAQSAAFDQDPPKSTPMAQATNPSSPDDTMCPVTTDNAVDLSFFAVYDGRTPDFGQTSLASISLGTISALVAIFHGLANSTESDYTGRLSDFLWWHRVLGIATAVVATAAWIAVERRARSATPRAIVAVRITVLAAALLVVVTGHFGGSLVFGWGYLTP